MSESDVDFRDMGAGTTELTIRQEQLLTLEDLGGNRIGWNLCLDKLERVVLGRSVAPLVLIVGRTRGAPVKSREGRLLGGVVTDTA